MSEKDAQDERAPDKPEISRPEYEELSDDAPPDSTAGEEAGLERAGEADVRLIASIGHCELRIKDLLALDEGQHLTLDKAVDAPVDLLVDGRVVGEGEIVVVGDNFGVRILRMASEDGN